MDGVVRADSQQLETGKKHSLGNRAFIIFLSRRIGLPIVLLILGFAAWYAERWVPAAYTIWGIYTTEFLFLAGFAILAFTIIQTYLEYRYYTYLFTDEAFIMTYGYMVRNEIATLYHHIQNVNIERTVFDRTIGVSKIVIMMTGSDGGRGPNQIILPAVGRRKAKLVQAELLRRARRHAESLYS